MAYDTKRLKEAAETPEVQQARLRATRVSQRDILESLLTDIERESLNARLKKEETLGAMALKERKTKADIGLKERELGIREKGLQSDIDIRKSQLARGYDISRQGMLTSVDIDRLRMGTEAGIKGRGLQYATDLSKQARPYDIANILAGGFAGYAKSVQDLRRAKRIEDLYKNKDVRGGYYLYPEDL